MAIQLILLVKGIGKRRRDCPRYALAWWVPGAPMLSKKARAAIKNEQDGGEIIVSSISAWEVAMLVQRGKLLLAMDVQS